MEVIFYKMNLDGRYVDKSAALTEPITKQIKLKKRPSNLRRFNIELDMAADEIDFNYCYIAKFGRYYFVGEAESLTNDVTSVPLDCDLLMSYKNDILASTQLVERNAKKRNAYMLDNEITYNAYDLIDCIAFPNEMNDDSIILMTVG